MRQTFLVTIIVAQSFKFTTIVESKIDLTALLLSLTEEDSIYEITPIEDYYRYEEVVGELRKLRKPEGLEYGKEE
ncbi:MAG: hypothetical protein JW924_03135 [Fusobacteriaceae bacterium]|nr:hypothetical protein [Fusobacteriaceae bacterium]